ncbi:pentatricopeptide repeat-containing protein At3g48250, chloroplastic-like [Gastrolobium bilobum]|uniref:pentatricopeptide repeat-containing protein At3g48250, chloroplastic-like n=1 Tax=Gastrolobium bilobum TaxID=150636 RepID=UPI002AB2CB91|nr:pentatricopeptide repeat-containing protein At3g48250, chloroplastic-like [Gastrolobium bilobum]
MNRLKAIGANLRFLDSPLAIRVIATRSLELTRNQVTHFSLYTPSPIVDRFPNNYQKLYFSSKPNSIAELVLIRDWSDRIVRELGKRCQSLTHESVIYVLWRLDENPEKASFFFNWVSEKEWFRASSSVYSLILRVLANKETVRQFWITLWMMKDKGFYLDRETYLAILAGFRREKMKKDYVALTHSYNRMIQENAMESVVTKVVGIISGSEWGNEVTNELAKLKIQLSDNFVIRVLKELRNCPLKAYKFFHWVGEQSGYEHNTVTYNAITRVLARTDSIEEFWRIIEEMKCVDHELDIDTYIKISRKLQRDKMMEDAVKLYELMMDGSYQPSVQDCSDLLQSISANDMSNLDLVFRVAKKYESIEHTLPKAIYDGIHRALTGAGKFDEAENIVKTMRNAGYVPDNITYSQVVFGLCKMRRLEEACKVLEGMESCGCIPDIKTWTILIQGHCAANEIDKALLCFGKMIEKGYSADAAVFGALVDGFLNQKRIDDAYKLLVEIVTMRSTSPWHGTYKKLIENLLGIGKFEEALNLLCLMRKHKYPPFTEPVVQYISKYGTVEDAVKFLKAWSKGSPRSHSAYLHVFESFFREGRLSEAKDLWCKCRRHISKRKQIRELFGSVENRMTAT